MNVANYHYVAAWQAVLAGENERALEHSRTGIELAEVLGGPFTSSTIKAARAQVEYFIGNHEEAFSLVEDSIARAREIRTPLPSLLRG